MDFDVDKISQIKDEKSAGELFFSIVEKNEQIVKAIHFAIKAHSGQYRKSGEPYIVHPILVATIVKMIGGDDEMVISALLHDTVEDCNVSLETIQKEFGESVAKLVDGLTKITEIREEELISSNSDKKIIASALSFRKMLISSIDDVRVLVIKLCDRLHNMLTLDALPGKKQKRISEETLVVYVPIAHRLGIAKIKNHLEDLCFYRLFPKEYMEITNFLNEHMQDLQLKMNNFINELKIYMLENGFIDGSFEIQSRIKHKYSIYQKLQRKGVNIDEILDLLAIRILVKKPIDCYNVLGLVHLKYRPLISRFKDYIAIPKDNGYQTIHTTVFHKLRIFEVQIRTFDMHKSAEFGLASHWKYKGHEGLSPKLEWLNELKSDSDSKNIDEIIEATKSGLYSEEITVFSPKGDTFDLPRGATVLDFAFAVHSEIGLFAKEAYVNKKRVPFLTHLKNGDIVKIVTGDKIVHRCSFINSVKTSRAKSIIKQSCKSKLRDLNYKIAKGILLHEFGITLKALDAVIQRENLDKKLYKAANDKEYLQTIINIIRKSLIENRVILPIISPIKSFKLKEKEFEKLKIFTTQSCSNISFDLCCHPKNGDEIVAIAKSNEAVVHHKFCKNAQELINDYHKCYFVEWKKKKEQKYKLIVSIENQKGALAKFLQYLAKIEVDLLNISMSKSEDAMTSFFDIDIEVKKDGEKVLEKILNQNDNFYNIVDYFSLDDAYNNKKG